jgi:hypothetical protein
MEDIQEDPYGVRALEAEEKRLREAIAASERLSSSPFAIDQGRALIEMPMRMRMQRQLEEVSGRLFRTRMITPLHVVLRDQLRTLQGIRTAPVGVVEGILRQQNWLSPRSLRRSIEILDALAQTADMTLSPVTVQRLFGAPRKRTSDWAVESRFGYPGKRPDHPSFRVTYLKSHFEFLLKNVVGGGGGDRPKRNSGSSSDRKPRKPRGIRP